MLKDLTLVCFAIKLDLVGLHHFLNSLSDVTQAHVDASVLQQKREIKHCRHTMISVRRVYVIVIL